MAIALPAVAAGACTPLDGLTWLLGSWEARDGSFVTREDWLRVSANTFEGKGVTLTADGGEVRSAEALRIVRMQDEVYLVAKVRSSAQAVPFRLTACEDGRATFENPAHDFPRKIDYVRVGEERIDVLVSDGIEDGFIIKYHKVNDYIENKNEE
jgi:hypothetical protein